MALKLDNSLLEELGLGALPDAEKQLLLRQIYEKLEMNVGMRLADQMSNEQLDAFEKFVDANDDKGAFQWLEQNFPNYKAVVNEEFEKLKAEIHSVAPQILATAVTNQSQQAVAGANPPAAAAAPQQVNAQQPMVAEQQSQQQYQPSQSAQQPYPASAMPQSGHLQPQYGTPAAPQPGQYQQPPAYQPPAPQQPPAGQNQ